MPDLAAYNEETSLLDNRAQLQRIYTQTQAKDWLPSIVVFILFSALVIYIFSMVK